MLIVVALTILVAMAVMLPEDASEAAKSALSLIGSRIVGDGRQAVVCRAQPDGGTGDATVVGRARRG
jgi:hypothetical protein